MATIISGDNGIDKVANGAVDLTTDVTGVLPQAQGGTGASSLPSSVTSLNGQTGAITNTSLYAIGSYVNGRPKNDTAYAVDATLAGSSLWSVSPTAWWSSGNSNWQYASGLGSSLGAATAINVGTWRCVSPAAFVGAGVVGTWVRIS